MDLVLLSRIRAKVDEEERRVSAHYSGNPSILVPVATEDELKHVEESLGFRIHPFLRELYLSIGNGGFGPGCSVFGTRARELGKPCFGVSSFGGLVQTFRICSADYEEETCQDWPPNLLPFIEFGCGLFGAVDCVTGEMYQFQGPDELEESGDTIDEFFENWLAQDVSDLPKGDQERRNGVNPFTGRAFEYRGNKGVRK